MRNDDTIVAVATPAGVGGIAVLRLSGHDALAIALHHLRPANPDASRPFSLAPRRATYCRFDDLDDLVAVYFPVGYTGQPTVELSCHGSRYVQQALLQALIDSGARLAERGEFTMRAFLNGRLDLSQAEAVADLIDAVTPAQHRLAVSQLRGGYAEQLKTLRSQLVDLTALLELELDFSQEDVQFADRTQLRQLLSTLIARLSTLISSFSAGNALKQGIPVAIVGRPNAGKSSLLNALLADDRAIVSPLPGTTRDTVEELLTIDGLSFRFIDTAGLRSTLDPVEALGVQRSRKAAAQARIILYVHDATTPWADPDLDLDPATQRLIVVLNKSDLTSHCPLPTTNCQLPTANSPLPLSSLTGAGLDDLRRALVDAAGNPADTDILLSNPRHRDALLRVRQALSSALQGLDDGLPADLLAVDLRDALYHLGTITGQVASSEVLDSVFSRFCIGK